MAVLNNNNPTDQSRRQGSGFTNLQKVMQANTGNRLGQAVGQGIEKTGEQTKQGLTQAQNEFGQQAEAGRLDTQENKERVQNVLGDVGNATDADVTKFGQIRAGQYGGPQNLQNIQNLQGQAQDAQSLGQATGSQAGRQGLLQRFAAAPGQYGAGQQRLDSLLLGASGSQPLKEARRSVSGLGQKVASAGDAAQGVAQQYQNLAQGFGQDVTNKTSGMLNTAQTTAQQRADTANAADTALGTQAQNDIQNAQQGNFSQQALDALGLQAGQRTYGINPGEYLKYTAANGPATALNTMQQPEFQQYSNLQKLLGQTPDQAPQTQYQAGKEVFDKDAIQKAIASNKAEIDPYEQQALAAQHAFSDASRILDYNTQFNPSANASGQTWQNASNTGHGLENAIHNLVNAGGGWVEGLDEAMKNQASYNNKYRGLANLLNPTPAPTDMENSPKVS